MESVNLETMALHVLQGLLASGHYTHLPADDGGVGYETFDAGEDWRKRGFPCRHPSRAVVDAFRIAGEFVHEVHSRGN